MATRQTRFEPLTTEDMKALQIVPPADLKPPFHFYQAPRGPYTEHWDIIGMREVQAPSALLEVRLFHLEQELIEDGWGHEDEDDWPFFDTFRDAQGFLMLSVEEYQAAIAFFANWLDEPLSNDAVTHPHFRWLDWDELVALRVRPVAPNQSSRYYQYLPDTGVAMHPDEVSLVRVPSWNGRHPSNQVSGLQFLTFNRRRLADPTFAPMDTWGLGAMRFNQSALRDLVTLLTQHTYERARLRANPGNP